ncbi:MAG: hypothetical protein H7177_05530 [Rhizobacter sp.]|nr:hypothetical protein [Bacteriovorax sp.]
MKTLIALILIFSTTTAFAEKSLEIKTHVVKMAMDGNNMYRLELREFAAVYHADEKFAPCLQTSIKEKKQAMLKVTAQSLVVLECKVN